MKINSATPVISSNVQSNKNKNVAFQGLNDWKPTNLLKLSRQGSMARNLFILNAFAFLLGTRIITSRDDDEKREIVIRDIPTIIIAVQGVPFIGEKAAELIQKKSGFAIMETGDTKKSTGIAKWIKNKFNRPDKPEMKSVEYSQLEDWYVYNDKLVSGFKGFSERLSKGGNLKKIYSSLNDDVKTLLAGFSDNNDEFIKKLFDKSEKSDSVLAKLEKEMASDKNNALKQASFMKTSTKLIGFGLTLALIGLFIPKLNIFITETIHKNKKKQCENSPACNHAEDVKSTKDTSKN